MQHQPTTSTYEARQRLARLGGGAVRADVWSRLCEIDSTLAGKGFPAMSDWWRTTLAAFYQSAKRQLILRVGRRGGKSSTLCRVAVAEALFGGHKIPAGDVGVFAIVSVNRTEANERLRTIEEILLGVGMTREKDFSRSGDTIHIVGQRIMFRTFAATRAAVRGFTCIGALCDEVAYWRNEDTGANPAEEILAALRPTMATVPSAKLFLSSSPFSTLDAHCAAYDAGQTDYQAVAQAPTWVANPTISEARTHELEPDIVVWTCEYKAEPITAGTSSFFDPGAVDAAVESYPTPRVPQVGDAVAVGADFGFRSDSSACCVAHRTGELYRVAELLELRPEPNLPLKPSAVVSSFAEIVKRHGAEFLMADGHYRQAIAEHLETHGLVFAAAPEGQKGKSESYVRARVLLYGGQLKLPKDDRLIRQLKNIVCAPTPGGGLSVMSPRKGSGSHGDIVSALVLAVWQRAGTEVERPKIPFGSPEYWAYLRSAEYLQKQEDASLEKDEEDVKRGDRKEWWDTSDQYARDM